MIILDIGCGEHKKPGSFGLDRRKYKGVNLICDFEKGLPCKDNTVDLIYLSHILEHIKDLIFFMEEIYRITKNGAKILVTVPYYTSKGAFRDPTHFRFVTEDTFEYFQAPTDYGIKTNFKIKKIDFQFKHSIKYFPKSIRDFCRKHFLNVVDEMTVILRTIKQM